MLYCGSSTEMALKIGDITGDYEIVDVLGSGGMGKVYKVRNVLSDRLDAMKVLLPDLSNNTELGDRFLREIKVQASLNHPNIASLYTALRVDNQLLMVMELVEGLTLEQKIHREPIPYEDAVEYLLQVLAALDYAHRRGVVHRDIKPANIILTPDGNIKLMDFGIARVASDRRLTKTGVALGSLFYMSPEQIKGESPDVRSDIYSLGVTFYEILTGKRPIDGDSDYSIMTGHLQTVPPNPAELNPLVPSALAQVILKALAKNPGDRFQTAEDFLAATVEAKQASGAFHQPTATPKTKQTGTKPKIERSTATMIETVAYVTSPQPAPVPAAKRSPLIWVGAAAGIIVLGAVGYSTLGGKQSSPQTTPPIAESRPSGSNAPVSGSLPPNLESKTPSTPAAQAASQSGKLQPQPRMPATPVPNLTPQPEKLELKAGLPSPAPIPNSQAVAQPPIRPTQASAPPPPTAPAPKDPRILQQEEWDRVSSSKDAAVFQEFIRKHPDSPFVAQAAARIEQIAWEAVKNSTEMKVLRAFRAQYPNGAHAAQAASIAEAIESEANGQLVQDALRRYQAAYENRDTDAIRSVWPTLGRDDVNKIDAFFKSTKAAKLVLQPSGPPKFTGDTASVSCKRSVTVQMKDGTRQKPVQQSVIVHLKKSGPSWVITALE
jgi:serine/threonine protein kinase